MEGRREKGLDGDVRDEHDQAYQIVTHFLTHSLSLSLSLISAHHRSRITLPFQHQFAGLSLSKPTNTFIVPFVELSLCVMDGEAVTVLHRDYM